MTRQYQYVKAWRKNSKEQLLEAFGGKCIVCSYSLCRSALEFHHLDSNDKDFTISSYKFLNWTRLVKESLKCILVCCRCHREIHSGLVDLTNVNQMIDHSLLQRVKSIQQVSPCKDCGKLKSVSKKYCSLLCARKNRPTKTDWDSLDLENLLKKKISYESIGKLVGVTGAAVKKRAKKLKLI